MKKRFYSKGFFVLRGLFVFVIVVALFGTLVMALWNHLMPDIFGLTTITFWQAVGLFVLSHILFGHSWWEKKHQKFHENVEIRQKWKKMTPEQREKFFNKRREFFQKRNEFMQQGGFGRWEGFGCNQSEDCEEQK